MKTISIVMPARNERDGIEQTIRAIPKDELERMGYEVQILVVDNDSNDGTGELAKKAGAEIIFEPRHGYGSAYKAGFAHATGDVIATADADLTYPVEHIPRLVEILERENLDFLTTDRFPLMDKNAMYFKNKVGNRILSLTMRLLFRLDIKDSQSGMWVFKTSILSKLKLTSNTPLSQELKIEACYFAKCRWKEVLIQYRPRSGKAKLGDLRVFLTNLLHFIKKRIVR